MPPVSGRRVRMPSRAALVASAAAVAATSLVAGCGATDIPAPRKTVTVLVDPPAASGATPAPAPSAVATETASATPGSVPTTLSAGRMRGAPQSYAEARARIEAASPEPSATDRFRSPTGNIVCTVGGDDEVRAACEVKEGRIEPPPEAPCPVQGPRDVGRIELTAAAAVPVCNSDTIREGGEPRLRYGSRTASLDPVSCISESFGVTCVDASTRHGFFVARDTFVTF